MMMGELLQGISVRKVQGDPWVPVAGIAVDSRTLGMGDVFAAVRGERADARSFVPEAIRNGAAAVFSEESLEDLTVPSAWIPELKAQLGRLSSRVYGEPSRQMTVIGVTGTNGKTTTSLLVEAMLSDLKKPCGFMGTLFYRWGGKEIEAARTTPEAPEIHRMLKAMVTAGVSHVVMECSSHGVVLGRLNDLALDVAVFTNLTQDHLDFHQTMESYADAKRRLFSGILAESSKPRKTAILNYDDPHGRAWSTSLPVSVITYSVHSTAADLYAENVRLTAAGVSAEVRSGDEVVALKSPLVGRHNLSNLLAALGVAKALGIPLESAALSVSHVRGVAGRLERVANSRGIDLFVDYAHTEDALQNVLSTLRPLAHRRLIAVFGCGGDRDRKKRPMMARAVAQIADVAIVTSDNPRTESPQAIVDEIVKGLPSTTPLRDTSGLDSDARGVACVLVDRRAAIRKAIEISVPGDIILIAGKGHETYQEINGVKHPFDDRVVAREILEGLF